MASRHGMRLDAADQSWHLSTPTPYDPPLTYGGWNQCRALGVRIASILHAREQTFNNLPAEGSENGVPKRRKKKHKVVIHTSPFLRCLQTSVAISAGMAQYEAPKDRPTSSRTRTPASMHSASPRMRGMESERLPHLAPIAEPKHDFAHEMARRALGEPKLRYRKSKLRVDAFLGEWLNPGYFDQITPPPPSPMMIAGAKAELLTSDPVDMYTPHLSSRSSNNSLWGGSGGRAVSKESTLDDWSHVTDALRAPGHRRERSNSASSVGSNESSGRKSPFRSGHSLQPLTSTLQKAEPAIYRPPTPSYAISNSDNIPRGYVAHARNATVNVDYSWDSSRAPQDWGNGGEFGEEWSAMHKRFRRGLNNLIQWYSRHNADDRGEDALGFEQADRHNHDEEEEEDLVVILVTHGAGSNALIGALTNQPVLLDVGMASLTMAVRRDDAPALLSPPASNPASPSPAGTPSPSPDPAAMMNGHRRRSSLDIGLSAVYDMKLVSSSEHLRPGADPTKQPGASVPSNLRNAQEALSRYKQFGAGSHGAAGAGIESTWNLGEPRRSNTSTAIGSIRRPSATNVPPRPSSAQNPKINPRPPPPERLSTPPTFTAGLWTPPSGSGRGTPTLAAQKMADEKPTLFTRLDDTTGRRSPMNLDLANSPPDSRPSSSNGTKPTDSGTLDGASEPKPTPKQQDSVISSSSDIPQTEREAEPDDLGDLPSVSEKLPTSLSRGLSQKGLWGSRPSGDRVARKFAKEMPKRRWTTHEND